MNTEITTKPIYWPKDLAIIKLTEDEKNILTKIIQENYSKLIPIISSSINISRKESCPRRIFLTHKHCFIILNTHGELSKFDGIGGQQKKITYVWDCFLKMFFLKKGLKSSFQTEFLNYLHFSPPMGYSSLGYPMIITDHVNKSKYRYFEELTQCDLPKWLKTYEYEIEALYIVGLLDALRKIHSVKHKPASFVSLNYSYNLTKEYQMFHGDISPNNILCKMLPDENSPRLMLTDFYAIGDINHLYITAGWTSPECIKYRFTQTTYQDMTLQEFMMKYGAKMDTWRMGLIVASLLRNGFHPQYSTSLPHFSFITNKLKIDPRNHSVIDESGIAELTQEEINSKIDALIQDEPKEFVQMIWKLVKQYLVIDPDQRPTLDQVHLTAT